MISTRKVAAGGLLAFMLLVGASGCSGSTEPTSARPLFEVWPVTDALEEDPIDSVAELVQRSELVVVGRIESVEVGEPTFATPDPSTPQAAYGGQSIVVTVKPNDASDATRVEFIYQFPASRPDLELTSAKDIALPKEDVVLAVTKAPGGEGMYRCTGGSSWCPLIWDGGAFHSPVEQSDERELTGSSDGASYSSMAEALLAIDPAGGVPIVGLG